jgi:hypothetical protein
MTTFMQKPFLPLCLAGLMALTRFHHFGSALSLPDASVAVFFLAGAGVTSAWFFIGLLLEAAAIDSIATSQLNVSDYCISPAYLFLVAAYGVMWLAGRFIRRWQILEFSASAKIFGITTFAASLAFAISNISFYGFSNLSVQMTFSEYLARTGAFYLPYTSATLFYSFTGLLLIRLAKSFRRAAGETQPQL